MLRAFHHLFAVTVAVTPALGQALLLRNADPVRVAVPNADLARVIAKVVAGPDAAEARAGLRSAVPARTRLLGAVHEDEVATITLDKRFLLVLRRPAELELALEQLNKSAIESEPGITIVQIQVEALDGTIETLEQALARVYPTPVEIGPRPEPSPIASMSGTGPGIAGALTGRSIAISPGHGYYWHSTLGWTTQRGNIGGLTEDIHTNEICIQYLIPYLENMGAYVLSCRERGQVPVESIADNDTGPPAYTETGAWSLSASSGYNGGSYRFASTVSVASATATWTVPVAQDGVHPIYAWFRASTNRSPDARYRITHSGGTSTVSVDQTRDDLTWVFLGDYHFTAAQGAVVAVTNESTVVGRAVIADAVKVGGGVGSIVRGAGTSGRARWLECSRYWAQLNGAPASVYNSISSPDDNDDDVTCRPRFAEWRGGFDAFVSLHTNAGGGVGTSSYIYNGVPTTGSSALQNAIHSQIITDVRAGYDPTWTDRGKLSANFGEVRELSTMPGVLVELAFHDTPGNVDHDALHDPVFRRISGRAMARGVLRYFDAAAPFPPEPPSLLWVVQDGARGLRVNWSGTSGATRYTVEQSPDGKGFVQVADVTGTNWSTGPLPPHTALSFRVRAWNASGRSFPTEVLSAGTSHEANAELLLVQGFDRLERAVKTLDNTFDYLGRHADAIRRKGEFSLGFDAATNEAVQAGLVPLAPYRVVDWACGEESTAHQTFSTIEQTLVANYLAGGGRLLVSGAEIGWDLDAQGTASDRAFYRGQLGAIYAADDAGVYAFRGRASSIYAGVPTSSFDNGTSGAYDVDFPDVLSAADASSTVCMEYSTGAGAGIQRVVGQSRVVNLGFPLETIVDANVRADVMTRALRFLLDDRKLEVPATVALGGTAPIEVHMPAWPNQFYALAASLGTGPIPLPNGELLALDPDGLFAATLGQPSVVFPGFGGPLDAQGNANAAFVVPVQAGLVGMRIVISGLTIQATPFFDWGDTLPWYRITIQ